MKFEHIVEINHPDLPENQCLRREQLWAGLVLRAEQPALFLEHLDAMQKVAEHEDGFSRELQFGQLVVRDRVVLEAPHQVCIQTHASEQHPSGTLTQRIEEPDPERLFVRFCYETSLDETDPEVAKVVGYVKAAYQDMDVEFVRLIRQRAAEGLL